MSGRLLPLQYQPPLPRERLVRTGPPAADAIELDVLIVGAGPAGLAAAIGLARLARAQDRDLAIGVLEKAGGLGEHCLSGAVVNPAPFRELFPECAPEELPFRAPVEREEVRWLTRRSSIRIPTPPTMRNHGNQVASIAELVRWLGVKAEALGVNLFTGFPAEALLVEGGRVRGVRTAAAGLTRTGEPGEGYQPPTDVVARVTILAEGTRGSLAQAWRAWQGVESPNPQIFALGVKEVWRVRRPLDRVVHTLGWPVPLREFGGTFLYPMGPDQVALGIVAGLDSADPSLDVHELLQRLKQHPFFRGLLQGGDLLEWGAKTIPEGGYWSLPERFSGAGVVMVGDCAGLVDVASLKGIHYAMHSGLLAARAVLPALVAGVEAAPPGPDGVGGYDRMVRASYIFRDLKRTRNMRLAFKQGVVLAGLTNAALTLTRGAFPGWRMRIREDAAQPRRSPARSPAPRFLPDGTLTFSKLDAVFKSGNATRDTIPSHLVAPAVVPPRVAEFYAHLCPAGVYEATPDGLRVNPPNCIDCKATDVLGPRWMPREGGSGPRYRLM
ncbi:MAG: 4Fe-4S dicluster domain-containing protein [Gemmatimonadales bacterium]